MKDYWKRDDEQEEKQNERSYVTRKEFYVCFLILLAVILWSSHGVESRLERQIVSGSRNASEKLDDITSQIYGISDEVASGIEEADNPLRESSMEIVAVDLKGKTATLRMTAMPKEYQEGMGITFFVFCDGAETAEVPATAGNDRTFTAEAKVPFCDEATVSANVKRGDTEYLKDMGSVGIEGQVLPLFNGYWSGSVEWKANQDFVTFDGEISVDIQKPDWMFEQKKDFALKNAKVEVCIDGKRVKTIPAELVDGDEFYRSYQASVTEENKIKLGKGQEIQFIFKAEDNNGLKYSYLVERGTWNQEDGYIAEESPLSGSTESGGRLTVE